MVNTGLAGSRVDETAVFSSTSTGPHIDCARAEGRGCLWVIHTVDATAGRVDKAASNASTGLPLGPERRFLWGVGPARSDHIIVLNSLLPMELHVETDELVRRIAEALQEHEERLLSQFVARVARELRKTPATSTAIGHSDDPEILGIKVHGLYPVSFVADRWDVSEDNVRKKSQGELPRSDWEGGEIRYRGIDILRYEGVDVEDHLDGSPARMKNDRASQSAEPLLSDGRPSFCAEENGDGRPYSNDLPALSDEPTSPD